MAKLPGRHNYDKVLLTAMKDEGPYLLDWLAFHFAIGFTHAVILTNDCQDGTDEMCRLLAEEGLITHQDNPAPYPRGIQKTAYQRMQQIEAVERANWLMALDVDEFLRINLGDGHMNDLMACFENEPIAISFVWQNFGNNGIETFMDQPMIERFTRSSDTMQFEPYIIRGYKTLYQAKYFQKIGTHRPHDLTSEIVKGHWLDANGVPIDELLSEKFWLPLSSGRGFGWILGRVNHYPIRSKDEYLLKLARGFVNRTNKGPRSSSDLTTYWQYFNWNMSENLTLANRSKLLRHMRQKLYKIPGILKLHKKAYSHHIEKVASLRQNAPWVSPLLESLETLGDGMSFDSFDKVKHGENFHDFTIPLRYFDEVTARSILSKTLINERLRS